MFAFPSRQCARKIESVGRTERLVGIFVLLLLAVIVASLVRIVVTDREYLFEIDEALSSRSDGSAGAAADSAPRTAGGSAPGTSGGSALATSSAESANPFPDAGVSGWRRPPNVARYTPDDLHVKINGRAEFYLRFDVEGLTFGTYVDEDDSSRTIDVYWYDMGTADNAAAVYRAESAAGARQVAVGTGGYQIGGAVFFWLGAGYVQVVPGRVDEADAAVCLKIAGQIAGQIAGRIDQRIDGGGSLGE